MLFLEPKGSLLCLQVPANEANMLDFYGKFC